MYFNGIEKFSLEENICETEHVYAHREGERIETLKQHMELALKYFYKLIESKNLYNIFNNFEERLCKNFDLEEKKLFREMLLNVIYMHDLGKININFQHTKMGNKFWNNKKALECNNSNHSCLSALIYMDHYFKKIKSNENLKDKEKKNKLKVFMVLNAYIISKHHSGVDSFFDFKNKFIDLDGEGKRLCTSEQNIFKDVYKEEIIFDETNHFLERIIVNTEKRLAAYEKEEKQISFVWYIYERFMLSILLACDYYSTSEFKNQCEIKNFGGIDDIDKYYNEFNNTKICIQTREYEKDQYGKIKEFSEIENINTLRKELFLDAEKSLLKNIDKNIFYLEAPTGSGKSNVAFNLTFKLVELCDDLNKLIYVYPFNTLVEQNINSIKKIFDNKEEIFKNIGIINSITPIKEKKKVLLYEEFTIDYEQSLLDRQFLHYPIILTTHVSLFNYFFGISKEDIFPLAQLCNSVIVLDEIQSYKNYIWKEIIMFLKQYSELLNIKFIIMSATLPKLDELLEEEGNTVNLIIDREKYFNNRFFKDRVKIDYSLLDEEEDIYDKLFNHVINEAEKSDKNILIEFINKKTANNFYGDLIEYKEVNDLGYKKQRCIEIITGDDNSIDRNKVINKIKKDRNIILVATQVIEAGVDIDMDIGYKDISMLDCDEQFLGRINRSCLKEAGKVYFFNLDSPNTIYKNDYRKEKSLSLISEKYETRKWLENKEFSNFYHYVLKRLNEEGKKFNEKNIENFIINNVGKLDFIKVAERMKLIDDDQKNYNVFFNRTVEVEEGKKINGYQVWNNYKELLKNNSLEYAEKKVKLSKVIAEMSYFIYKVQKNDFEYSETIGDIYYIEDGEQYFDEGKFNRNKFEEGLFS